MKLFDCYGIENFLCGEAPLKSNYQTCNNLGPSNILANLKNSICHLKAMKKILVHTNKGAFNFRNQRGKN
jgi:hypothetical protein